MHDDFDQVTVEEFYNEADDISTLPVDDDETPAERRIRFESSLLSGVNGRKKNSTVQNTQPDI